MVEQVARSFFVIFTLALIALTPSKLPAQSVATPTQPTMVVGGDPEPMSVGDGDPEPLAVTGGDPEPI